MSTTAERRKMIKLSDDLRGIGELLGAALERAEQNCQGREPSYGDIIVARNQIIAERKRKRAAEGGAPC